MKRQVRLRLQNSEMHITPSKKQTKHNRTLRNAILHWYLHLYPMKEPKNNLKTNLLRAKNMPAFSIAIASHLANITDCSFNSLEEIKFWTTFHPQKRETRKTTTGFSLEITVVLLLVICVCFFMIQTPCGKILSFVERLASDQGLAKCQIYVKVYYVPSSQW